MGITNACAAARHSRCGNLSMCACGCHDCLEKRCGLNRGHPGPCQVKIHRLHDDMTIEQLRTEVAYVRANFEAAETLLRDAVIKREEFRAEVDGLKDENRKLSNTINGSYSDQALAIKCRDAEFQISAWRPVIEAAKAMCKKDRWPYLNLGPLAHALDALDITNDQSKAEECTCHPGHKCPSCEKKYPTTPSGPRFDACSEGP